MMTRLEIVASEEEAPIPVLPDCANPGIALRVFLLIQAMLLCVAWSASDHVDELIAEWTAQQFAVLPAMLIGLPLMSLTRRRALLWPEWMQWVFLLGFSASLSILAAWWTVSVLKMMEHHMQDNWFALLGRGLGGAGVAAMIALVLRWREQA